MAQAFSTEGFLHICAREAIVLHFVHVTDTLPHVSARNNSTEYMINHKMQNSVNIYGSVRIWGSYFCSINYTVFCWMIMTGDLLCPLYGTTLCEFA